MFHSIYITTESGVCIFAKHFIPSKIDNQLISGFMNALGSFATEALGSGMQSLKLQTGEQLAILRFKDGKTPLIGIVVADGRDNPKLIQNLLSQILIDFYTIFQRNLEPQVSTTTDEFEEFSYTVDTVLEGKISARTNLQMLTGWIVGLILIGFIILSLIPAFIELSNLNISELGLPNIIFSDDLTAEELQTLQAITLILIGALMGFNCVVFFLPTFLAAYIAGNRKRGIWTALLIGGSIGVIILIATPFIEAFIEVNAFLWYVTFSPLLIALSILCGIYGGRLKERRRLYPLEKPEKNFF